MTRIAKLAAIRKWTEHLHAKRYILPTPRQENLKLCDDLEML